MVLTAYYCFFGSLVDFTRGAILLFLQFPLYFCMVRRLPRVMMTAATNTPTKSDAAMDAIISISVDDICMSRKT